MTELFRRRESLRGVRSRGLLRVVVLLCLLAAGPATASGLLAQEQEAPDPLLKNEVVSLLTSGLYTPAEAARRIRNRCLAFRPTERDLADFRDLGAAEPVMVAIRECMAGGAGGGGQARGPLPAAPPLWLAEVDSTVSVAAGDTATVFARVMRGERPVPGTRVVLRDPENMILEQPGAVLQAASDSLGGVRFRVPAPTRVGELPLVLDVTEDSARVRFRVRPAAPGRVDVEPRSLRWRETEDSLSVSLRVADPYGNLLPSVSVALVTPRREMVSGGETGPEGRATLRVSGGELGGLDSLGVIAGGRWLASLPVVRERAEPADDPADVGAAPDEPPAARDEVGTLTAEAERLLAAGRPGEAARVLRRASEIAPDDADVRIRLAEAQRAAGDEAAAAETLREAMARAPDRREELRDRLRAVIRDLEARRGRLTAWGGDAFGEPSFMAGSGLQRGLLEVWPVPGAFGLFVEYDRGVEPRRPELVRGSAGFESVYAGTLLEWGAGRTFSTRLEVGRRERPPADLEQRIYRLEQTIRLGDGTRPDARRPAVRLAAALGDWRDAAFDEYFLRGGVDVPVLPELRLSTDVMFTDAVGTWPSTQERRHRIREYRLQVAPTYRSGAGFEATVGVGVGRVAPLGGQGSDHTLVDTFLRGSVPLSRAVRLDLFYRHQAPALNRELDFHVLSAGLTADIPY